MIHIRDLSFSYEGSAGRALQGVSMEIPDGEFLGLIGSSGAGKSTLTYALNGIVPHHYRGDFYGEVRINGMDTLESRPDIIARQLGSVFQDIESQMTAPVVEDEILFGLENFGVPRGEIETRIEEALGAAGIGELRNREIRSLSGGQKQKVVIAAVTALRPGIMVLDEPTGELDPQSSRRVFEYLKLLNETYGVTIILVEQKIMLLCEFARTLAVMDRGRLILRGNTAEVLQEAEVLERAGVNIPRVTTLGKALRERGLYRGRLPGDLREAEAMMRAIGYA
ncbi:MAG: ATP-binding cassette domain-containing protein [Treponema sp.]|jgi:energy-coupling factor transport system ATP-binding protein|nr:ATP-binding cassette domain-containing protein [Treponema sp.]